MDYKSYHIPVLLNQLIENFKLTDEATIIDGTMGFAGHATAILEKHGEQYRRFTYPEENKSPFVSEEINQFISKDIHEQLMNEKDRVISLLEFQNQQLIPLADKSNKEHSIKLSELKSIAEAAINELPTAKSTLIEDLKDQLSNL